MQRKLHGQMSESFLIAGILSISGGLQDAYTYMSVSYTHLTLPTT